jgi:hypothetical protein
MTSMTVFFCLVSLVATTLGVAVLPWSNAQLESTAKGWKSLHARVRGVAPMARPTRFGWRSLEVEAGVRPPLDPLVWAAPVHDCARCA